MSNIEQKDIDELRAQASAGNLEALNKLSDFGYIGAATIFEVPDFKTHKDSGLLEAAIVAIGGAMKETFSNENNGRVEQLSAEIKQLNHDIEQLESNKENFFIKLFGADGNIVSKIESLTKSLETATAAREELLNPKMADRPPVLKMIAADMAAVDDYADSTERATKASIDAGMKAADEAQKAVDKLMKDIFHASGEAYKIVDELGKKSADKFDQHDTTKDSLESIGGAEAAARKAQQEKINTQIEEENSRHLGLLYGQQESFIKQMQLADSLHGKTQVGIYAQAFAAISSGAAQHNKALFDMNKAAGIASAIISTYSAANKALDEMGPIAGPIAATAITAMGLSNVAAIEQTQYAGGGQGTTPSSAGVVSSVNSVPVSTTGTGSAIPSTTQNTAPIINIYGDIHGNDAERLMEEFQTRINNSDFIIIDAGSRQAAEIRNGG